MSLTYICAVCGEPGNVYSIDDIYFVDPCDNHCSPKSPPEKVIEFQTDIIDEKNGIFQHDEEWCKENNYEYVE